MKEKQKKERRADITPQESVEMYKLAVSGMKEDEIAKQFNTGRPIVNKHIAKHKAESKEIVLKDFTEDIQRIAVSVLETQTQGAMMLQDIMKDNPESKNVKDCLYRINANNRMVTQSLQALGVTVPMRGGDSLNKPSSNIYNIFIKDVYVDSGGKSLHKKEDILAEINARRERRMAHMEFAKARNKERFGEDVSRETNVEAADFEEVKD